MIDKNFRGNAYIESNGKVMCEYSNGYADISNRIPNTTDTRFACASMSKTFVAVGILQLIEKGELKFDDELENILGYMPPANIEIIAENLLNYMMKGNAFVAIGQAFTNMFQLTDSYNITWEIFGLAAAGATGSGTCEIELTDSFKDAVFASEAEAGAFVAHGIAERIEVSDTFQGTIQLGSAANVGNGITYTEII